MPPVSAYRVGALTWSLLVILNLSAGSLAVVADPRLVAALRRIQASRSTLTESMSIMMGVCSRHT